VNYSLGRQVARASPTEKKPIRGSEAGGKMAIAVRT
jgi:hypothetical protein